MKIGLFSSYGMKCGIAQYNLSLFHALVELGHSVTIFGNRLETVRADRRWLIASGDDVESSDLVRCFNAGAWSETGDFDYPVMFQELRRRAIEAVILQYQNGIFNDINLIPLFQYLRQQQIPVIVTFHDSCIGPHFPFHLVDKFVCANLQMKQLLPNAHHIPHGVPTPVHFTKDELKQMFNYQGPLVSTFGLGRTDYNLISRMAADLGYKFLVLDSTNSCLVSGDHIIRNTDWLPLDQLMMRLAAADVIVLWYPEIAACVSSSAVNQALATLRPVIVNDVGWFKDVPEGVVIKVRNERELQEQLLSINQLGQNQTQLEFVEERQWKNVAGKYLKLLAEPNTNK
ncbi:hypothetical protein [Effusibacillus lacus]|uniref:Glycosyltransferase subfamily 4-like N-terminal domain-containing protein n=1 Tax=Effusibacillus lacus TaxID=1348429 RepID=A0A292YU16_9BACL|nr:hypothetical protein [Effusibacillus lacus]GAX91985.1 hypothetical protein EFBL_3676 [Effusibacillus lacus]